MALAGLGEGESNKRYWYIQTGMDFFKRDHDARHFANSMPKYLLPTKKLVAYEMTEIIPTSPSELVDPQAQKLVGFLSDMGLPSENITRLSP